MRETSQDTEHSGPLGKMKRHTNHALVNGMFYFFQRKPKVTGEQGSNTASER